jgi:hypothetical protein
MYLGKRLRWNHRDALLADGTGATRCARFAWDAVDAGLSGHTRRTGGARPGLELLDELLVLAAPTTTSIRLLHAHFLLLVAPELDLKRGPQEFRLVFWG